MVGASSLCGCLRRRRSSAPVSARARAEDGRVGNGDNVAEDPKQDLSDRGEQESVTGSVTSGRTSASRSCTKSPSATSFPTSLASFHSAKYRASTHKGLPSDMQSDVPTIAESVADMQDFADLHFASSAGRATPEDDSLSSLGQHRSWISAKSSNSLVSGSPGFAIDLRPHPLGVLACSSPRNSEMRSDQLGSSGVHAGDLGVLSDVPSMRDDSSVCSAPSEICVNFPVSPDPNWSSAASRSRPISSSYLSSVQEQREQGKRTR